MQNLQMQLQKYFLARNKLLPFFFSLAPCSSCFSKLVINHNEIENPRFIKNSFSFPPLPFRSEHESFIFGHNIFMHQANKSLYYVFSQDSSHKKYSLTLLQDEGSDRIMAEIIPPGVRMYKGKMTYFAFSNGEILVDEMIGDYLI